MTNFDALRLRAVAPEPFIDFLRDDPYPAQAEVLKTRPSAENWPILVNGRLDYLDGRLSCAMIKFRNLGGSSKGVKNASFSKGPDQ